MPTKKKIIKSTAIKELEQMAHAYRVRRDPNAVKKYYSEHNASELEKCIILYSELLKRQGFKVFAVKTETTGRMIVNNQDSPIFVRQNNTNGKADINLIVGGCSIEVEVKCKHTRDRYQNDAQKIYEKKVIQAGGLYWLVREFAEFKKLIDNYLKV